MNLCYDAGGGAVQPLYMLFICNSGWFIRSLLTSHVPFFFQQHKILCISYSHMSAEMQLFIDKTELKLCRYWVTHSAVGLCPERWLHKYCSARAHDWMDLKSFFHTLNSDIFDLLVAFGAQMDSMEYLLWSLLHSVHSESDFSHESAIYPETCQ